LCQNSGVGWFDSRRWWTVLCLIPFTTPYNRGLRILRRAAKGRVRAQCHPQTNAGGIEGGASTRPRRRQAGKAQRPRQAADPCGCSKTPKFASMMWRAASRSASAHGVQTGGCRGLGEIDSHNGHSIQGPYHDSRRRRDRRALRPSAPRVERVKHCIVRCAIERP
jgi:hypothetical protein